MIINHKVKIDLVRQGNAPKISVVQGDIYTRRLMIALFSDKRPWMVPEGACAVIRYLKPDRTSGAYDTLADGTSAVSISGNVVSLCIAPEALTLSGNVSLIVTLILGQQQLSTFEIDVWVQPNFASSTVSEEGAPWITGFLPAPGTASSGQHFVVDEVDSNGRILSVNAVDPVTIDWNAGEGDAGYVRNRTHWTDICVEALAVDGEWVADNSGVFSFVFHTPLMLTAGKTYLVNWDGVEYTCIANTAQSSSETDGVEVIYIGNPLIVGLEDDGLPFAFLLTTGNEAVQTVTCSPMDGLGTHSFSISEVSETVHKLHEKFLPAGYGKEEIINHVLSALSQDTCILEEQTVEGFVSATLQAPVNAEISSALVVGNTYTVVWDGAEYTCECITGTSNGGVTIQSPYLGNAGVFFSKAGATGYTDTAEPFFIAGDSTTVSILSSEEADSHTVAIFLGEAEETELPAVTAVDNGKFLRVVDGAWAAATVNRAEEASF